MGCDGREDDDSSFHEQARFVAAVMAGWFGYYEMRDSKGIRQLFGKNSVLHNEGELYFYFNRHFHLTHHPTESCQGGFYERNNEALFSQNRRHGGRGDDRRPRFSLPGMGLVRSGRSRWLF
jgi:hypothetical protein